MPEEAAYMISRPRRKSVDIVSHNDSFNISQPLKSSVSKNIRNQERLLNEIKELKHFNEKLLQKS